MNIKITYKWLLEYLDTDADAYELQKYLSLCGPSVETVEKVGDDYVLDIEITSNRVDMASVFGIAQEAQAILPQFGKKAILKTNPLQEYTFTKLPDSSVKNLDLNVNLTDHNLATRITAIIISNIKLGPSPNFIKERLEACEIRSINNVVDISNYLMISLGQPTHTFDYDRIKDHTMIIREAKKGETVTTLDNKKIELPGGDIAIEDGTGKLIDLAGIMGGLDSEIKSDTKNVILFIETYNKRKIRRTSMTTGQRTMAATYFEKGLDEERIEPTLVYGAELLQKYAGGTIGSKVFDIYPKRHTAQKIKITQHDIVKAIGVEVTTKTITSILENLGFTVQTEHTDKAGTVLFEITVPSWRKNDIAIKEDIVEEVARVYGYHRLPNMIQSTTYVKQPQEIESLFSIQHKVKHFLKHIGLHESMNYSMVSEQLIKAFDMKPEDHLMLANTISEEIKYMRRSVVPSLIKNIKDNTGKKEILKFFEIVKVYNPQKDDLPDEKYKLGIAVNTNFYDLKGILEALMNELHIAKCDIIPSKNHLFASNMQAEVVINGEVAGAFGQIKPVYKKNMELDSDAFAAELNFEILTKNYRLLPTYVPTNPYAVIKLDLTTKPNKSFAEVKKQIFQSSKLLKKVELIDTYKNNITLRFYFSSEERNITEDEAKNELDVITKIISQ